jgi:hypothetical protein
MSELTVYTSASDGYLRAQDSTFQGVHDKATGVVWDGLETNHVSVTYEHIGDFVYVIRRGFLFLLSYTISIKEKRGRKSSPRSYM